jgi:alpha-N-arabinofuranosidase
VPQVSASAAKGKDGKIYVALVNTNPNKPVDVTVNLSGAKAGKLNGQVLTAAAMDAHNTFANPEAVKPVPFSAAASGGKVVVKLPAKSVVVAAVE